MNLRVSRCAGACFALNAAVLALSACEQKPVPSTPAKPAATTAAGADAALPPGPARPSQDFEFDGDWRCLACGHSQSGKAGTGPRPCPKCGQRQLWNYLEYYCPDHGAVPVAVQYDEQGDASDLKVAGGPWRPAVDPATGQLVQPQCPTCGRRVTIRATTRSAFDFDVNWRCLACGHTERKRAAPGPQPCSACGKAEAWVSINFACREHGDVPVLFQYTEDGKIREVRIGDGAWVPQIDTAAQRSNLRCPTCGGPLNPADR